ncbi:MAG: metal-dependent transcriptional regulator [Cytophagales bacterium]|nr:metal-dependent transcriptional regulator [Cytophagales bacterium]
MSVLSNIQEDYLKAIYKLSRVGGSSGGTSSLSHVSTSALSNELGVSPATVSDALQRLHRQGYVSYQKYKGVGLSQKGEKVALHMVRRHRIWEVFLHDKLRFSWDEVHERAEKLEHLCDEVFTNRLDEYLDYPRSDPHGDPIPDEHGKMPVLNRVLLSDMLSGQKGQIVSVCESDPLFLQYMDKQGLILGSYVEILDKEPFDNSLQITLNNRTLSISDRVAKNLWVVRAPDSELLRGSSLEKRGLVVESGGSS